MKNFKLSLLIMTVIFSGALTAFTSKTHAITAGWYGQPTDVTPPGSYNASYPINASDLTSECPSGSAHLCAVYLKSDGTLDGTKNPNTVMSSTNFQP
jgi:hypothetical protein